MLKTKTVNVKIGPKNYTTYDELGYYADIGDTIKVKVEDLLPTTSVEIKLCCDICEKKTKVINHKYCKDYSWVCDDCKPQTINNKFIEGTEIYTYWGWQKVEDIKVGTPLWCYDDGVMILKLVEGVQTSHYSGNILNLNSSRFFFSFLKDHYFFTEGKTKNKLKKIYDLTKNDYFLRCIEIGDKSQFKKCDMSKMEFINKSLSEGRICNEYDGKNEIREVKSRGVYYDRRYINLSNIKWDGMCYKIDISGGLVLLRQDNNKSFFSIL